MHPVICAFAKLNPKLLSYQPTDFILIYQKANLKKNLSAPLWIICGPGGAGKDTIIQHLLEKKPKKFRKGVTSTTRPRRPEEKEGIHYFFMTQQEFDQTKHIERNFFNGFWYGIPAQEIKKALENPKVTLFQIDLNALQSLNEAGLANKLVSFFVLPESWQFLKTKYASRHNPSQRMRIAKKEIAQANLCNLILINLPDQADQVAEELIALLKNQRLVPTQTRA
jgi:guanylate kinase